MPLIEVEIPEIDAALPSTIETLIREAQNRIDLFGDVRRDRPIRRFIPSDFTLAYDALAVVAAKRLAPGRQFCEWGSGFGVVTLMAAILGFDACGIEIEEDLVVEAEKLARDFDLPVEFHCRSYIPEGYDSFTDDIGNSEQLSMQPLLPSEQVSMPRSMRVEDDPLSPAQFDLIYVYPWPGEESLVEKLFEATASEGAILLSNHAVDDMRIRRLVTCEI
ncbi:MAG: hypothetical protein KJ626_12095 [Verrucomicrobia bacterium]|nr:hypothetical protein [Verrucomicrobiota bacterium]